MLYSFNGTDGKYPDSGMSFDAQGNLFGATYEGGTFGFGTIFELSPSAENLWTETVLYSCPGAPGMEGPGGKVILDGQGDVYGVTQSQGPYDCPFGCGTAFELSPGSDGQWSLNILHDFSGKKDGRFPTSGLIFDKKGNLFGTASGSKDQAGTVFRLVPASGGQWREDVLYSFKGGADGKFPYGITSNAKGGLYGVATSGGDLNCGEGYGCGVIFEVTP